MLSTPSSPSKLNVVNKSKAITVERLQAELYDRDHQIIELKRKLYDNKNEQTDDTNSEIIQLRTKLEQAERLANEYKAQLHTQTLKTSANNSKNHLSEIELERIRARLQKRIEELEPLPELLKQVELKNEKLQKRINELEKRSSEQSTYGNQTYSFDRIKDNQFSSDDNRTLQR
jgi:chromosome segregation ATPase